MSGVVGPEDVAHAQLDDREVAEGDLRPQRSGHRRNDDEDDERRPDEHAGRRPGPTRSVPTGRTIGGERGHHVIMTSGSGPTRFRGGAPGPSADASDDDSEQRHQVVCEQRCLVDAVGSDDVVDARVRIARRRTASLPLRSRLGDVADPPDPWRWESLLRHHGDGDADRCQVERLRQRRAWNAGR